MFSHSVRMAAGYRATHQDGDGGPIPENGTHWIAKYGDASSELPELSSITADNQNNIIVVGSTNSIDADGSISIISIDMFLMA